MAERQKWGHNHFFFYTEIDQSHFKKTNNERSKIFFYYYKYFPSYPVKSRKIIDEKSLTKKISVKTFFFFLWLFCLSHQALWATRNMGINTWGQDSHPPNPIRPTWDNVVESLFDNPLSTWRLTLSPLSAHDVVRVFTSCLQHAQCAECEHKTFLLMVIWILF